MIAAMGNINIMEASQRTGTWLLLHAHGIITQSHRQQQLQIKANIKSGNFPWHRLKVTSSGTNNLQLASLPPTLNLTEANLTKPHFTSPHLTSPHLTQRLLCFLRAICEFERISGLCCCLPTLLRPPYPPIVSPPTRFVIVLLGKCRAHGECHVFFAKLMTDSIYIIYNPLPSFSSNFGIQKLFAYNSIAYHYYKGTTILHKEK